MLVVFPTNRLSKWLITYVTFLKNHRINVMIILDNPTQEDIRTCEEFDIPNHRLWGEHEPYIEDFIADVSSNLPVQWIVRLDSDEWISLSNLKYLESFVKNLDTTKAYGISRKWVKVDKDFKYPRTSRQVDREIGDDFQFRLYQNANSLPFYRCHTPGIRSEDYAVLPKGIVIVHLLWTLREVSLRSQDQVRYAQYTGSSSDLFRDCYVPEEMKNPKWQSIEIEDSMELQLLLTRALN